MVWVKTDEADFRRGYVCQYNKFVKFGVYPELWQTPRGKDVTRWYGVVHIGDCRFDVHTERGSVGPHTAMKTVERWYERNLVLTGLGNGVLDVPELWG